MIQVWSRLTRLMHWSLVGAFCIAFYTRHSEMMRDIHVEAGYVAGAVILLRWIHGFVVRDFAAFRRFPPRPIVGISYLTSMVKGRAKRYISHNPAGAIAVYGLLLLGSLVTMTGYLTFNDMGLPFGLVDEEVVSEYHGLFSDLWLGLICLHITGVIAGSFVHKENLPLAMLTGMKKRRLIPERKSGEPVRAPLPDYVRRQYIEEAAYYIAESRGFQGGQDWDDWLQAEQETDQRLRDAMTSPEHSR